MKQKIKKIITTTIFLLVFSVVYSQSKGFEYFDLIQAGSSKLSNGWCKIEINKDIPSFEEYYVVITPIGNYNELYVSEKTKESFEVRSSKTLTGNFDYVIYAKCYKPIPSGLKREKTNKD
jgi:hypothetical protein